MLPAKFKSIFFIALLCSVLMGIFYSIMYSRTHGLLIGILIYCGIFFSSNEKTK